MPVSPSFVGLEKAVLPSRPSCLLRYLPTAAPPPCHISVHCSCGPTHTVNVEEMGCILFILFLFFFFGVYSFQDTDTHYFNSLSISPLGRRLRYPQDADLAFEELSFC